MLKTTLAASIFSFCIMFHGVTYEGEEIPILQDNHVHMFKEIAYADVLCFKDKQCRALAEAAYYEARSQDDLGLLSVMKVVLNRTLHPKWPNTIPEVVYDRCQFSFTCDGSKGRRKSNLKEWRRSYTLAYRLLIGNISVDVGGSTHYHTKRVRPKWAKEFRRVAVIGDHIFYNCDGKNC
jgi:spore germination cell wall hydrolase CwlJ-like protein